MEQQGVPSKETTTSERDLLNRKTERICWSHLHVIKLWRVVQCPLNTQSVRPWNAVEPSILHRGIRQGQKTLNNKRFLFEGRIWEEEDKIFNISSTSKSIFSSFFATKLPMLAAPSVGLQSKCNQRSFVRHWGFSPVGRPIVGRITPRRSWSTHNLFVPMTAANACWSEEDGQTKRIYNFTLVHERITPITKLRHTGDVGPHANNSKCGKSLPCVKRLQNLWSRTSALLGFALDVNTPHHHPLNHQ